MSDIKTEEFMLRPYTPKELRTLYGISRITFKKWIAPFEIELGKAQGRCYTVNQVMLLIDKLCFPSKVQL
ncbi:MAG: hypothetical protein ACT4ON_13285 [Bacteroidota bacterium]